MLQKKKKNNNNNYGKIRIKHYLNKHKKDNDVELYNSKYRVLQQC